MGALAGCSGGDGGDSGDGGGGDGGDSGDGGGGDGGGSSDGGGDSSGPDLSQYLITDINGNPPSLDPHAIDSTANTAWGVFPMNAYEPLLFYEPSESTLQPVLAEEVPTVDNGLITNDNRTFEFPLRQGVQFHTGGEMTSEDVKYSIDRVRTMNLTGGSGLDRIESIETPDDYTVRITIDEPYAAFLNGDIPSKNMVVMSKEAIENNGGYAEGERNQFVSRNTVGTGPYQLGQWNPGSNIRYDYFDDYWAPDTVGPSGIFQRIITDVSTSVATMDRGEAHASGYELANVESYEGTGVEFNYYTSFAQLFLFFNFEIPYDRDDMPDDDTVPSDFFQDPRVRQAFGYAIDYEDYIDAVWAGNGYVSNQPCHLEPFPYYDEDAPNFNYDPERAQQLLDDAGYGDGFTFTMMSENFAEAANAVLYFKDSLEALNDNITINTQTFTEAQYVERRGQSPWAFTCDIGGFPAFGPDPAPYYEQLLYGPAGQGGMHQDYVDDRMFEAADAAAQSLDPDERQELYSELQRLGVEDPPALSLNAERLVHITQPCVEPGINPAASKTVAKRWDISECDPIDF